MKKYKIIILLLITLLLSGCSGNYNISLNVDSSLEESLDIELKDNGSLYERAMDLFVDNDIDSEKYSIIKKGNKINIKYEEKYKSIEDYLINSKLYSQFFNDIDYTRSDEIIDIRTSSKLKLNSKNEDNIINDYDISLLKINIKTPFKVLDSNADDINEDEYSWILSSNHTEKDIMISMNSTNSSDNYIYYIVIGMIGLIVIVSFINVIRRIKKENKL